MADLYTLDQAKNDSANWYVLAETRDGKPMYRRMMAEQETIQAAREEWLEVLAQLWIAYDKEIDPERLGLYQRQFGSVPLGLLQDGVDRAIREHTYNSVPTVADVWRAIRAALGNPRDLDAAIRSWDASLLNKVNLLDVAVETEAV